MTPCKVCSRESREGYDTCSVDCEVEAWAATWAETQDQKRYASWSCRRRRAEARGEPFTESMPLDATDREWLMFLWANPRLKALWDSGQARAA